MIRSWSLTQVPGDCHCANYGVMRVIDQDDLCRELMRTPAIGSHKIQITYVPKYGHGSEEHAAAFDRTTSELHIVMKP